LKSLVREGKVDYAKKPISREAWEHLWAEVLADFIHDFESYACTYEEDADELPHEWFIRGMVRGMWTIYNMVESLMVREK